MHEHSIEHMMEHSIEHVMEHSIEHMMEHSTDLSRAEEGDQQDRARARPVCIGDRAAET